MMYLCDVCGCYLDPGEGHMCDDCRVESARRSEKRKRINEMIRIGENEQYEMILRGA